MHFSEAPKTCLPCAIALVLDISFFQSDLISQLQRLTFFTVHVQNIPQPLAIPSASHVWGLPFESKLFVERHYLTGNSSVKTWWSHCYSRDHLSPFEDKICQGSPPTPSSGKIATFGLISSFTLNALLLSQGSFHVLPRNKFFSLSCSRSYFFFFSLSFGGKFWRTNIYQNGHLFKYSHVKY